MSPRTPRPPLRVPLPVRYIEPAGWQRTAYVYWWSEGGCRTASSACDDRRVIHIGDGPTPSNDEQVCQEVQDGPALWTPERCGDCGKLPVGDLSMGCYTNVRWTTPSGRPEPGDLFYVTDELHAAHEVRQGGPHAPHSHGCPDCTGGRVDPGPVACRDMMWHTAEGDEPRVHTYGWHNCDGRHLVAILPNGIPWDIDSRASNCTMPEDRLHRCWPRTGRPELGEAVHVSKDGYTCDAGAGSISTGDYHGFLHAGRFTPHMG